MALVCLGGISGLFFFFDDSGILPKDYWSMAAAGMVMIAGGMIDDRFNLKPGWQFLYQALAAIIILAAGDTINHIRLPGWGVVNLPGIINYFLSFWWIILVINAFNWFDGMDGMAGGVGFIGFLIIFFLSLTPLVAQPQTAAICIITAGGLLGFLFFNFYPAKIYLGTAGSGFIGLMLALVSIYSGAKVATAALVLGIPILDLIYVTYERIKLGIKPWRGGDRLHLHYRLADAGVSQRTIIVLMYGASAALGIAALNLQTGGKMIIGILLIVVFGILIAGLEKFFLKKHEKEKN